MILKTDFLVIGSGIAGLTYALKTAKTLPDKSITIICKSQPKETNTRYAQGGIAAVSNLNEDSIEKHIQDTLKAGDGLCDEEVVETVVKEGPKRLAELMRYGVSFDKTKFNSYDLAREGGHSCNRIFHKGDFTGLEIEKKLLAEVRKQDNIKILDNMFAIDLITHKNLNIKKKSGTKETCYGANVLQSKGQLICILAKITLLATGGVGRIFNKTTNSPIATGDGIAMAFRAGAKISNMEFIQFHPTALYQPGNSTNFLISEAVRGLGAVLKTTDGVPFMQRYDKRGDLATRDVVSRAIDVEIRKNNTTHVFLDCTRISKKDFRKHFPTIATKCVNMGINPEYKMIPIAPSAHYCCGGIDTDLFGNTSIRNLYACGECTHTGLHGSNRLASNSLLEALVFAHRAYTDSIKKISFITYQKLFAIPDQHYTYSTKRVDKDIELVRYTMSESIGITTSNKQLKSGLKTIEELYKKYQLTTTEINFQILELKNMIEVSLLILRGAIARAFNSGVFYNVNLVSKHKNNNMITIAFKDDLGQFDAKQKT